MDILFIGGVFLQEQENEILSKSHSVVQFAANNLQWNLINGLDICNGYPVSLLNSVFVGSYPNLYTDIFIKSGEWSHKYGVHDINVGFLNVFGIKHIWRGIAIAKHAIKWAQKKGDEQKVIIIYSMHTPFMYAAAKAKLKNPNVHVCLIAPDLPEFMNLSKRNECFIRFLKAFDMRITKYLLRYFDSFVLLTKQMAERINIGNRPWIVIEGVVTSEEAELTDFSKSGKNYEEKVLLYTGTLQKAYGIIQLLEAFNIINNSLYRLWICGAGEAESNVREFAERDHRIKYFGQITREEAIKLHKQADVLINPRGNEGEFTKYSFPSKIMEYLLSGTPALVHRLPGMPEEYHEFVYLFDDESVEGMAGTLERVLSLPKEELHAKGTAAKEFVLREKNNLVQAKRIIELIKGMENQKYS